MIHTPVKMVNTRSTTRKERENKENEDKMSQHQAPPQPTERDPQKDEQQATVSHAFYAAGSSAKAEYRAPQPPVVSTRAKSMSSSSSSSVLVRRKQLELEAAKKKAEIQMVLISKKLELDLANLLEEKDENYSPQRDLHTENQREVERWLDQSQYEQEAEQRGPDNGYETGPLPPPRPPPPGDRGTADGTVQMLASAIHNLTAATANNRANNNLLSRICTPRDLPTFSGDPLEWLQFKQTYEESTEVCGFTAKENLWRLRKCLAGPAKEAVSALMISATSPDIVIKTLELLFGNPDCIINKITQGLKRLPPMSAEYNKDIVCFAVKVQNFIAAVRAVGRDEYLQGVNIASIILAKLPTVLVSKWSDYSFPIIKNGKKSRLEILGDFLNEEAVKITTTANTYFTESRSSGYQHNPHKGRTENNNFGRPHTVLVQSAPGPSDNKCLFCHIVKHKLTECKMFKKALRKDRWRHVKRYGVCYKCLVSRHDRETCPAAACDKDGCGQAHHRLLHYVSDPGRGRRDAPHDASDPRDPGDAEAPVPEPAAAETVTHINSACKVLLKVVPINILGPNGIISTTALLDDGSTISLISGSLAARAGLRGRTETMRVSGAWSGSDLVVDSTVLSIDVSDKNNCNISTINVRSVDNLKLPEQNLCSIDCSQYAHLQNLKHELLFNSNDIKPEVLIGQDNHHLLIPIEMCVGKRNEPSATRTTLGWSLHGVARAPPHGARASAPSPLLCCAARPAEPAGPPAHGNAEASLRELHEEVKRSFLLDALGVSTKPRQNGEDERARAQLERSATLVAGRWHVALPWRDEGCALPDSYANALHRLKGVEKKMLADPDYATRYSERVNHLLANDFAEESSDTQRTPRTWYLPHFGVDNPNKKKLRLVFDAAAKSHNMSLNDYLLQGPDLLASLFGIMVRFRENRVAVVGDIKDMFLRVKIRDEDQNSLRFLWRPHSEQTIKTYKMKSLIFGANCSPFVAQYVKNRNAERFTSTMPAAVDAICNQHYMDDYLDSFPDETTATQMVKDIVYIHKEGGFEMRNWTSNSVAVLDSVPKETLGAVAVSIKMGQQYEGERTLGLIWYPAKDEFGFDLSFKRIPEDVVNGTLVPTKRVMLRVIMSIYDVFGFLSPFTIQGKIMLQNLWLLNIGWDDKIPNNIFIRWKDWIDLLKIMSHVRIPRCYLSPVSASETENHMTTDAADIVASERSPPRFDPPPSPALPSTASTSLTGCYEPARATSATTYNNIQLHVFCDASTKAMCAVAYWRWTCNNKIFVAFIASKCRVAPVKPLTVPRLELQAALLAARLADTVIKEHKLSAAQRFFWSDSTTVLYWINNDARNYKTFVANRLGEIDELSTTNEWRYVPTKLNVADIATRETYDDATFKNEWLRGPTFLRDDESSWPRHIIHPVADAEAVECVNIITNVIATDLPIPEPERFSLWLRLLRSTAVVLKFIHRCRKQTDDDCKLMEQAERLLFRQAQGEAFGTEVSAISEGKCLPRGSRILSLSPYLDEHGVLRCGGRIGAALDVPSETKTPIILDGRHHVTRLLVRHFHVKAAHGNQETVVNNLKQRYWIVKIRPTVKHVAARCMICRIKRAKPEVPVMGDLPPARMAHHQRPFTHCGVDLFGPMEVVIGKRREKRYGVLFTCLTVRAVHLEIVHSLTTDSMIMALRRMAARRGWPRHLYSDNGTNLRGADTELKKSIQELNDDNLRSEAVNNGAQWAFIPPASPHWGGAWERLIRSVKVSLGVVLKERAPKDEVLATFMTEVENIVNSRPLTHVSVEPGSSESLTPNHFLLGTSSSLPTAGAFDDSDLCLRKQWRKSQRLADMYWRRWVTEYLPELVPRKKWNEERAPLKVGDLVLVVDPGAPRNVWQRAIVQQVFPGKDGRVRLVEVKTKSGTLRRSAARVAKIPVADEC